MPQLTELEKLYEGQMVRKEKEASKYVKKYGSLLESLEHSPLKAIRPITWMDHYALGRQLDQFCDFVEMCEDDGTVSQLGKLPLMALDLLSFTYGVSPINAIASVQPIDDVQGMVMFRDVIAQNNRGNVQEGQSILSTLGLPQAFPKGYASDTVFNETLVSEPTGAVASWTNIKLGGTDDNTAPIYNQRFAVRGTFTVTRSPNVTLTFNMSAESGAPGADPDTTGNFSQVIDPGSGNKVFVAGHVDYTTGTVTSLEISETPTSDPITFFVDYVTLPEAMADIQKVVLRLQQKPIWARLFTLKGTLGTAEAYQLKKRYELSLW